MSVNWFRLRYILPKMPRVHSCVKSRWVTEKLVWMKAFEGGASVVDISSTFGVSRKTFYKWYTRYQECGVSGLMPIKPGCAPGSHPSRLSGQIIDQAISEYDDTGRGPRSIEEILAGKGVRVSHMSIYRHLIAKGKITPRKRKRKTKDARLHVADYPGQEAQIDVMHVDPIAGTGDEVGRSRKGFHYQYTLIDDCTRTQYATLFDRLSQNNTCEFLDRVITKSPFGLEKVRMDNGAEFQTKVKSFLKTRGITQIYNQPSRPDQNGKVERVHRTDTEEFYLRDDSEDFNQRKIRLNKYLIYYNNQRPHWGLGMDGKTPLSKLQSFHEYQSVTLIV